MANRDLKNCIEEVESVRPQVATGNVNGEEVDARGADSVTFIASIGAITGGTGDASIEIQESDTSGSGYTAVAAADLLGTEPTALAANTTYRIGYIGNKRYLRAVLDIGTETNVAGAIVAIKGHLSQAPEDASFAS